MPWHIVENSSQCPTSKPHAVIQDDNGHLMGCHESTEKAKKQLAALYVHEHQPASRADIGQTEWRAANVDAVDVGQRIITVLAVPYEQAAQIEYPTGSGRVWNEVFTRGAFDGLSTAVTSDPRRIPVTAVLQPKSGSHEGGLLIGKVISATPEHDDGLLLDLKIADTDNGHDTLKLAADDMLSPSIGFAVMAGGERLEPRGKIRRITRAHLDHLSLVAQPAYSGARVLSMRAADTIVESAPTPLLNEWRTDPDLLWAAQRAEESSR